jgi:hypothetical protein
MRPRPKAEGRRQKAEGRRQKEEAGSRKQEAGSRKQEGGSRKEEAGSRKQEGGSRKECLRYAPTTLGSKGIKLMSEQISLAPVQPEIRVRRVPIPI